MISRVLQVLVLVSTLMASLAIAQLSPAYGQAASSTTLVNPSQQNSSGLSSPSLQIAGVGAGIFLLILGAGIVFIWLFPTFFEDMRAFRMRTKALLVVEQSLERMNRYGERVSVDDLKELLRTVDSVGQSPSAKRGITQTLMAFTIVTILGIALFALMLSESTDAADLRKTIITALLSVLATIVGFYFGTQAAESTTSKEAEGKRRPQEPLMASIPGLMGSTPGAPEAGEAPELGGETNSPEREPNREE